MARVCSEVGEDYFLQTIGANVFESSDEEPEEDGANCELEIL